MSLGFKRKNFPHSFLVISLTKCTITALNYGALGGKIIGAGGGGFLLLYINKEKKAILQKLFKNYIQVPIIPENEGSKIIFNGYS